MTPERMVAPEIGVLNHAAHARRFHRRGVRVTVNTRSTDGGEVDHAALLGGQAQKLVRNAARTFQLFRNGDAMASRNIHAALFDALRLA